MLAKLAGTLISHTKVKASEIDSMHKVHARKFQERVFEEIAEPPEVRCFGRTEFTKTSGTHMKLSAHVYGDRIVHRGQPDAYSVLVATRKLLLTEFPPSLLLDLRNPCLTN